MKPTANPTVKPTMNSTGNPTVNSTMKLTANPRIAAVDRLVSVRKGAGVSGGPRYSGG